MPRTLEAAPRRAAFFSFSVGKYARTQLPLLQRRRHFIARERREAAYRVDIEAAIDRVKQVRSAEWLRALMHRHVLRTVNTHGGERLRHDDSKCYGAQPGTGSSRDKVARSTSGYAWPRRVGDAAARPEANTDHRLFSSDGRR